jgi:hypothetical protein
MSIPLQDFNPSTIPDCIAIHAVFPCRKIVANCRARELLDKSELVFREGCSQ